MSLSRLDGRRLPTSSPSLTWAELLLPGWPGIPILRGHWEAASPWPRPIPTPGLLAACSASSLGGQSCQALPKPPQARAGRVCRGTAGLPWHHLSPKPRLSPAVAATCTQLWLLWASPSCFPGGTAASVTPSWVRSSGLLGGVPPAGGRPTLPWLCLSSAACSSSPSSCNSMLGCLPSSPSRLQLLPVWASCRRFSWATLPVLSLLPPHPHGSWLWVLSCGLLVWCPRGYRLGSQWTDSGDSRNPWTCMQNVCTFPQERNRFVGGSNAHR